jgi:glycosyltransferase involved in cell wall biosynthesis
MKILAIVSTMDLRFRYGCTPAWWQLFKALYDLGNEIAVIPYQGSDIESLWWHTHKNPCEREAMLFSEMKNWARKFKKGESGGTRGVAIKFLTDHVVKPKWRKHLLRVIEKEKDVGAVVLMGIPINQLTGLPSAIKREFSIPFLCYDGDLPASLPYYGGFSTGFSIYEGADLSEFDAFLINSEGGIPILQEMGAKKVYALQYGADPEIYRPIEIAQDFDVFFYGWGYEYRKEWMELMLKLPSRELDNIRIAVGGGRLDLDLGKAELLGDIPFSTWRNYCCRSKINLNITRSSHAELYATSTSRPFELASLGCCIVSNPYNGLEKWFEPNKEVFIAENANQVIELYKWLLSSKDIRKEAGRLARERVLREHTFKHRAIELMDIIQKTEAKSNY